MECTNYTLAACLMNIRVRLVPSKYCYEFSMEEEKKGKNYLPLKTSLNSPGGACKMKSDTIRTCKCNQWVYRSCVLLRYGQDIHNKRGCDKNGFGTECANSFSIRLNQSLKSNLSSWKCVRYILLTQYIHTTHSNKYYFLSLNNRKSLPHW